MDLAVPEGVKLLLPLLCLLASQSRVTLRGHDARGHWFDLTSQRGHAVAITFGSRRTEKEARVINDELAKHVQVVNVVDLRGVPDIAHDLAKKKICESDGPRLFHLVDPDGQIARGFAVDPQHHVDIFLVDGSGHLMGHYLDHEGVAQVEARLRPKHLGRRR